MTETQNLNEAQRHAQKLLRETGYNASILKGQGEQGETFSRAMGIWRDACNLVKFVFSTDEAQRMIADSWNPNNVEFIKQSA